jgi:hypothetical protein
MNDMTSEMDPVEDKLSNPSYPPNFNDILRKKFHNVVFVTAQLPKLFNGIIGPFSHFDPFEYSVVFRISSFLPPNTTKTLLSGITGLEDNFLVAFIFGIGYYLQVSVLRAKHSLVGPSPTFSPQTI